MRDISKPLAKSLPLELQLLTLCARTRLDGSLAAQLRALVGAEVDWKGVLEGARHHGVTPLLYRHLNDLGAPHVPAFVLHALSSYTRKNTVHNLLLSHALLGILKALERRSVEAVPYKGPVLASSAYGDVSLRSFKDLDIIVRPPDFKDTATTLQNLGYGPRGGDPKEHFHETFVHSETRVTVELHHDVVQRRDFPIPLELSAMWRDLTQSTLLGQPVASFSPEDTLLLLCLHGSTHRWRGLTWICDVSEYVKAHPQLDWELFLQKASRAKLSRTVSLGLHLAHTVLAVPLPKRVLEVFKSDRKLPKLSEQVLVRMHKKSSPLREVLQKYQFELAMQSGSWGLPLYRRFITSSYRFVQRHS